jgi:hypothetical protein
MQALSELNELLLKLAAQLREQERRQHCLLEQARTTESSTSEARSLPAVVRLRRRKRYASVCFELAEYVAQTLHSDCRQQEQLLLQQEKLLTRFDSLRQQAEELSERRLRIKHLHGALDELDDIAGTEDRLATEVRR